MFDYISHVYLLLITIFYVYGGKTAEKVKDAFPPIDQNLPLIMIKAYSGYEEPSEIEIKTTPLLQKKILFRSYFFYKPQYFCPLESDKEKSIIHDANKYITSKNPNSNRINKNCLFKLKIRGEKFKTTLPQCKVEPKPVISKDVQEKESQNDKNSPKNTQSTENLHSSSSRDVKCGADDSALLFLMGYSICQKFQGSNRAAFFFYKTTQKDVFPLLKASVVYQYKFCYTKKKEVLYTLHGISRRLMIEPLLAKQRKAEFDMLTFGYPVFGVDDYDSIKSKYHQIENSDIAGFKFKIQKLVPPDDFPFALHRKSTYHYINTNLIHEDLQPFWDHINNVIRKNAIDLKKYYNAYTGAFKLSPPTAKHVHIFEGIQIPEIWIKVLHRQYEHSKASKNIMKNEAVAIIANNYLSKEVADLIDAHFCQENLCEDYGQKDLNQAIRHIQCCPLTDKLKALFGFKFQIHRVLKIDGFIKSNSINNRLTKSDTTL